MEITEVRIKLMEEPGERLKAFCSITFRQLLCHSGLERSLTARTARSWPCPAASSRPTAPAAA